MSPMIQCTICHFTFTVCLAASKVCHLAVQCTYMSLIQCPICHLAVCTDMLLTACKNMTVTWSDMSLEDVQLCHWAVLAQVYHWQRIVKV